MSERNRTPSLGEKPSVQEKPSVRERLASHERPGSLRKGPPITVRCPCGARRELGYGEVWRCACGRRWDTSQIDAEQYGRLRRLQLRFRVLPICIGLATSLAALFFLFSHNTFSLFVLLPAVLIGWGTVLRPIHRRRYAAALGQLPRWELRSE
ncbi:MAG TPA: hypothetical protein VH141_22475 [Pseudonocardia sp.]|jgi:hypothetical protein|nr:hypothetical protein [Pseudonocardia sp.]